MTLIEVVSNDPTIDVTARAMTWPEKARGLQIVDDASYLSAGHLLRGIKALRGEVDSAFDGIISKAHEAHREACAQKRKAEAPLVEAESAIKSSMGAYTTAQELLRQAEERRLREEARIAAEDRRLEEAASLEREAQATGDAELMAEAVEMLEQPIIAAPVYVPAAPKVAGISTRANWTARVTNVRALIMFVAQHPEHANLLTPNQAALNGLAKSMTSNLRIPGVESVNTPVVSARR